MFRLIYSHNEADYKHKNEIFIVVAVNNSLFLYQPHYDYILAETCS